MGLGADWPFSSLPFLFSFSFLEIEMGSGQGVLIPLFLRFPKMGKAWAGLGEEQGEKNGWSMHCVGASPRRGNGLRKTDALEFQPDRNGR